MAELKITAENFEQEVLKSELPVLIDLWAPWCGPCRMIAPIISQIADEYKGKLKVGKINVDEETELTAYFRVTSIPKVVLVEKGEIKASSIGFSPKDALIIDLGLKRL